MTNSKHIRDLYPEVRLDKWARLLVLCMMLFWGGAFWFGSWLLEDYPIGFLILSPFFLPLLGVLVLAIWAAAGVAGVVFMFWSLLFGRLR